MAFRAVLFEKDSSGSNSIWIVSQRIYAEARFLRSFLQFRVDGWIVFLRCCSRRFVGTRALRKVEGRRK
jgi:hypothetical protein